VSEKSNLEGWLPVSQFDPAPGGPLVATYCDGSGAAIFLVTDYGEVLDGESLDPVENFDAAHYSLYAWLPDDFVTWGMRHDA